MTRWTKLINFTLYQVTWMACVLLAARHRPILAAAITIGAVALHLLLVTRQLPELKLIAAAGAIGLLVDSWHLGIGIYSFPGTGAEAWLPPPWIVAMWMLFAITLRSCMSWIVRNRWIAALGGLIGGPLAFVLGERMGAVTFADPRGLSLLALGVAWAASLSLLAWYMARQPASAEVVYRRPLGLPPG